MVHEAESSSPKSPAAAAGAAAAQPGRSGLAPPGAKPAQQPGASGGAPQQQQSRPLVRPALRQNSGGSGVPPGGPSRPQQPATVAQPPLGGPQQPRRPILLPPPQQQRQQGAGRPPGQVRGEAGAQAGGGAEPTLERPKRPPPSTVNVFASIMSDMQVRRLSSLTAPQPALEACVLQPGCCLPAVHTSPSRLRCPARTLCHVVWMHMHHHIAMCSVPIYPAS